MINIKLTTANPNWPIERQTPQSQGIWGDYQFFINKNIEKCDYWVVFGGLKDKEKTICPKENTIFVATEPKNIKKYSTKFLKQFGAIIASTSKVKHPNIIHNQQASPWMIDCESNEETNIWENFKGYNEIKKNKNTKKDKLISVITSNKNSTREHRQRLAFVVKLKKHFGEKIDVFGKGINKFKDKRDIISPYRYHIAIENCSYKDHFSEKLSDTFLAETYPIYYGCTNIYDYFPKDSLTTINVKKPKEAIKIIESLIESNQYEKSVDAVKKAKELVLNKYNIFPMICYIIEDKLKNKEKVNPYEKIIEINPESFYPKKTNLIKKIFISFKNKIKNIKK